MNDRELDKWVEEKLNDPQVMDEILTKRGGFTREHGPYGTVYIPPPGKRRSIRRRVKELGWPFLKYKVDYEEEDRRNKELRFIEPECDSSDLVRVKDDEGNTTSHKVRHTEETVSLDDYVGFLEQTFPETRSVDEMKDRKSRVELLKRVRLIKQKYILTTENLLDMKHLLHSTYWEMFGWEKGNVTGLGNVMGYGNEIDQLMLFHQNTNSAFSMEDMFSNAAGLRFARSLKEGSSFSRQLKSFLENEFVFPEPRKDVCKKAKDYIIWDEFKLK